MEKVQEITKLGYSKEQILKSKKYTNRKDILAIVLEDGKIYSHEEIEKEIDKFMKKEVK